MHESSDETMKPQVTPAFWPERNAAQGLGTLAVAGVLLLLFSCAPRSVNNLLVENNIESEAVNMLLDSIESNSKFRKPLIVNRLSSSMNSRIRKSDQFLQYTGTYLNVDSVNSEIYKHADTNRVAIHLDKRYKKSVLSTVDIIDNRRNQNVLYVDRSSQLGTNIRFVRVLVSDGRSGFECFILIWNTGRRALVLVPFIS